MLMKGERMHYINIFYEAISVQSQIVSFIFHNEHSVLPYARKLWWQKTLSNLANHRQFATFFRQFSKSIS